LAALLAAFVPKVPRSSQSGKGGAAAPTEIRTRPRGGASFGCAWMAGDTAATSDANELAGIFSGHGDARCGLVAGAVARTAARRRCARPRACDGGDRSLLRRWLVHFADGAAGAARLRHRAPRAGAGGFRLPRQCVSRRSRPAAARPRGAPKPQARRPLRYHRLAPAAARGNDGARRTARTCERASDDARSGHRRGCAGGLPPRDARGGLGLSLRAWLRACGLMPPLLQNKHPNAPSVFRAPALLREARRQTRLPIVEVPPVCILDPDGDIVRRLRAEGRATPFPAWPCYHTQLDCFDLAGETAGIVGCAVGAPFAVLIAEEMFASGCKLLLS